MKDQLLKSPLQTWKDLHNVTFLQELGDGQGLCNSVVYPQLSNCGQDHHHANHLAKQDHKEVSLMKDTLPQPSSNLLTSVNLQSCLESRLQKRLKTAGSMIFTLSLKNRVTQSGLPFCQVVSSVHRTKGNDYFSGQYAAWLTPTVTNIGARSLEAMEKRMAQRLSTGRKSLSPGNLWEQVRMYWGVGTVEDQIYAETGSSELLNPLFPCWLMAFPLEWDDCGASVMQ